MSAAIHGRVHGVCVFAIAVALVTLGPGLAGAQGQGHCPMHQARGQGAGQGQHHHGCPGCGRQAAQAQPGGDGHAADM